MGRGQRCQHKIYDGDRKWEGEGGLRHCLVGRGCMYRLAGRRGGRYLLLAEKTY